MLRDTVIGWTKEAEQQGLERGRLEGRQEGEASLLLRQLERRFGNLDPETRQRVQSADVEELLEWGDRFVEARTLDEVFQDPS